MKKINCILLVDDDPTTNFLNQELIEELEVTNSVHVTWNGQEALDYLNGVGKYRTKDSTNFPRPNIIFLDINMPVMDGYVFLDHYANMPVSKRADIIVVFLTTSDSQQDRDKASTKTIISDFLEKPLKREAVLKVVKELI